MGNYQSSSSYIELSTIDDDDHNNTLIDKNSNDISSNQKCNQFKTFVTINLLDFQSHEMVTKSCVAVTSKKAPSVSMERVNNTNCEEKPKKPNKISYIVSRI